MVPIIKAHLGWFAYGGTSLASLSNMVEKPKLKSVATKW